MSLASTFDTATPPSLFHCSPPIPPGCSATPRSSSAAPPGTIIGHNEFLGGLVRAGRFRVSRGAAADGADVTQIIYDTPKNPRFMRGLTDEVRETAPGRFLGRGMMELAGRARNVFWFTVTKE